MIKSQPASKSVAEVVAFDMQWFLIFVLLSAAIIIPRWYYVENFAVALPYWDQWDSEWDGLLRPWTEGKLRFSDFWKPNNEHRILPTRLMTLLSFELTGTWSNLTEARLNIPLGASTPLLLIWLLHRMGELRGTRWIIVPVVVAGAALPFSWENMLIGFQSQFYFLNLFALSAIALAVYRPTSTWAILIVIAFCILSVLTMASGLLTPVALAVVYFLDGYIRQKWPIKTLLVIPALLTIAVTGYLTMPYVEAHNVFHAQNITEMYKTTIRIMGWPLTARKLYIGLVWLPALIVIPTRLIHKKFGRCDLLMTGCFAWAGFQIVALAYGRGHNMYEVGSRYTEVLHLGLAANAWFILRSTEGLGSSRRTRIGLQIVALTFFLAIFVSYTKRVDPDLREMRENHETRLTQTRNVSLYLKTRDKTALQKTGTQIPYPNPERLQQMLDNPALLRILPPLNK